MTPILITLIVVTVLALIVLVLRARVAAPVFSFTPNNRRRRHLVSSNLLRIKGRKKQRA